MNEEIKTGLVEDIRELDPVALAATPGDGTDTKDQKHGGDSDGTDTQDNDETDAGDADGTDNGDADGTDKTDGDGTDNA